MATRNEIVPAANLPKKRASFRGPLLLGLSLLAAVALFDAAPAAAQFIGIRPFGIPLGVHLGGRGHYRGRHYRHRSYHRHRHHGRRHAYRGHRHRGGVHVPKI